MHKYTNIEIAIHSSLEVGGRDNFQKACQEFSDSKYQEIIRPNSGYRRTV
jgi:hypothetical protein